MKKSILSLLAVGAILVASAQQTNFKYSKVTTPSNKERCATSVRMQELKDQDPVGYNLKQANAEQAMQSWIANHYDSWKAQRAVITIPVVVQIWDNTSNVPDIAVTEQLNTLNEDFRKLNADVSNTPAIFSGVAADCEIEFCLASKDPQGNATNGIIRKTVGGSPAQQGGSDLWDPTKYLNIFVYNLGGGGILGYTYLASQAPNNAVHIGSNYFGTTGAQWPINKGRTATHEVGHWLNLEHIWGDSNCGSDQVSDTPPAQSDNFGCPNHPHNSGVCSGNTDGEMFMNYMDYVDDACMVMFTEGQKARMISAINLYRPGLLTSAQTNCSGISAAPDADFTANTTSINIGQTVDFTDLSTGTSANWSHSWSFAGGTPSTSTASNPTGIQYTSPGVYTVTLTVDSGSVSDTETKTNYITVIDPSSSGCSSTDTVNFPLNGTLAVYGTQGGGYLAGTNEYGDLAKANYVTNNGYLSVEGVVLGFSAVSGSASIPVKIWADNAGSPGAELGSTSVSASAAAADAAAGAYTFVTFPTSVNVTGSNFFIGFEIPSGAGDTVSVYTNSDGDTNPGTGYELWSDGTWYDMVTAWQGLNIELSIHPIVCNQSSGIDNPNDGLNSILYPNPTAGTFTIYTGEGIQDVFITITDVTGKLVRTEQYKTDNINLNMESNPTGIYFVRVDTPSGSQIHKVQVIR